MSRELLIERVIELVESETAISKSNLINSSFCGRTTDYRQGIYFLYNTKKDVIYVGKVGSKLNTSLYDRMYGNGPIASHQGDVWWNEVEEGRFHRFSDLNDQQILQIERLAIFGKGQPIYNDSYTTNNDAVEILKLLPPITTKEEA